MIGEKGRPVIQFLHANAYIPECYSKMFRSFSEYQIILPRQRPLWDNSDSFKLKSWQLFKKDIILHMDTKKRKGVIGMGHSMGGVVSLLASVERPELFSQLVLIDPVILPGFSMTLFNLLPYSLLKKTLPFVKIAAKRKHIWKDRDDARLFFLTKKVYQRFDKEVLEHFIQYGLKDVPKGVTLSYPRDWESRVYASAPNVWSFLKKVTCPVTIIKAEYSDVINEQRWLHIQKMVPNGRFIELKNTGHLVPFEKPGLCADTILKVLDLS